MQEETKKRKQRTSAPSELEHQVQLVTKLKEERDAAKLSNNN